MEETIGQIQEALDELGVPGEFATGGRLASCPPPGLIVAGVGQIAFPLLDIQAQQLLDAANRAPFGKGADTVVDVTVRNAWEIDAARVATSAEWVHHVQRTAIASAVAMGWQQGQVQANLYKLVLYDSGGFFRSHKDTEKEPGMFGTLVMQLPVWSGHTGGTLKVRHGGVEKAFGFSEGSDNGFFSTAFFCDCEHELTEVKGYRLCLIYNLVYLPSILGAARPRAVDHSVQAAMLRRAADSWTGGDVDVIAVPLEHQYTKQNLCLKGLKGKDRAIADVLRQTQDVFCACLALVEKHESGTTYCSSYNQYYSYGSDDDSGEDAEMDEILDSDISLSNFVTLGGKLLSMAVDIDWEQHCVWGDPFKDMEPTRKEYEGYTGNAGPSLDQFYNRAVLVVWRRSRNVSVLCDAGEYSHAAHCVRMMIQRGSGNPGRAEEGLKQMVDAAVRSKKRIDAHGLALRLCAEMQLPQEALKVLAAMAGPPEELERAQEAQSFREKHGMQSDLDADAVACCLHMKCDASGQDAMAKQIQDAVLRVCKATLQGTGRHFVAKLAMKVEPSGGWERFGVMYAEMAADSYLEPSPASFPLHSPPYGKSIPACQAAKTMVQMFMQMGPLGGRREAFAARAAQLGMEPLAASLELVMPAAQTDAPTFAFCVGLGNGFCDLLDSRPHEAVRHNQNGTVASAFGSLLRLAHEPLALRFAQCMQRFSDATIFKSVLGVPGADASCPAACIIASRYRDLLAYGKPCQDSWEQASANVPGHPEVTAFLRSPGITMQYAAFNNIKHARNFASKHFSGGYNASEGHSAQARAEGAGRNAYVVIVKNQSEASARLAQWSKDQEELQEVIRRFPPGQQSQQQKQPQVAAGTENRHPKDVCTGGKKGRGQGEAGEGEAGASKKMRKSGGGGQAADVVDLTHSP